jgi:DNA-binding transcriptional MocR family regulator
MKREKSFGTGRTVPLDRNDKHKIMTLARALSRRTEPGRAYGALTAKALAVLGALLWQFHNARSGLCIPSYERLAEAAGCARSTVAEALKMLERVGLLTWCNRIERVRARCRDLFGNDGTRWRVVRISNGYRFTVPGAVSIPVSSKSEKATGTINQVKKPYRQPSLKAVADVARAIGEAVTPPELAGWKENPPQLAFSPRLRARLGQMV